MSNTSKRQLKLGAHIGGGDWKSPENPLDSAANIHAFIESAQTAEEGLFDFGFRADSAYIDKHSIEGFLSRLEPLSALSAVAAVTKNIGLLCTMTTSYSEPFTTARQLASLDKISGGRAAWNVVTSALEGVARNHGGERLHDHSLRYKIADEYVDVVKGLWESWEDDAFTRDRSTGKYVDREKMHTLNHKGEFFSVQGPLNIERSPQGHPVLFQAGASNAGRELAARTADAIFSGSLDDVEKAREYYTDVKKRALKYGRNPDHILLFPSIGPVIGDTEEDALRLVEEANQNVDIDEAVRHLGRFFSNYDFSIYPLDEPLPELGDLGKNSFQTWAEEIKEVSRRERLTLRQLAIRFSRRPDRKFVGTAEQVADSLQHFFENRTVDGYIIGGNLRRFVDEVVPILQKRGIYRTEYEATTLRGNLGLPFPVNRHALQQEAEPQRESVLS